MFKSLLLLIVIIGAVEAWFFFSAPVSTVKEDCAQKCAANKGNCLMNFFYEGTILNIEMNKKGKNKEGCKRYLEKLKIARQNRCQPMDKCVERCEKEFDGDYAKCQVAEEDTETTGYSANFCCEKNYVGPPAGHEEGRMTKDKEDCDEKFTDKYGDDYCDDL